MLCPRPLFIPAFALLLTCAHADVKVANMKNGETVRYPVVLLQGTAQGAKTLTAAVAGREVKVPVEGGAFKVLARLQPGPNTVLLTTDEGKSSFKLTYKPSTSPYRVNVVFVVASDEKPTYDGADEVAAKTYASKLATAALLMQTYTAESMHRMGFGRTTFNMEFGSDGLPVVHTVRYPVDGDSLRLRDGGKLYGDLYDWIDRQFPTNRNKNLVLMGFSRFNPTTGRAEAHTALGGGGMGLFGNTAMYTWPTDLADVYRAFSDPTVVDGTKMHDDSAGRSTAWGLASTTIGAMLHEMGHTFGLPHTGDPTSIMQRGFDRFNRMFTVIEPPTKGRDKSVTFGPNDTGRWEPRSAAQLACLRWFQPDDRKFDDTPPTVVLEAGQVVIRAKNGIGAVVFLPSNREVEGDEIHKAFWSEGLKDRPKVKRYSLAEIAKHAGKLKRFRMIVMDSDGNQAESEDTGAFAAAGS
jgi:hypothetical protein